MGRLALVLIVGIARPIPFAGPDYIVQDVDGVLLEYPVGSEGLARQAHRIYLESIPIVEEVLGTRAVGKGVRITIAPNRAEFERIVSESSGGGPPPHEALAVALPRGRRMVIKASSLETFTVNSLPFTVRHELVHLVLAGIAGRSRTEIPRWFDEGVAEYVSGKPLDSRRRGRLRAAARSGRLPPLEDLALNFPVEEWATAYPQSHSFIEYAVGRFGKEALEKVVGGLSAGVPVEDGWEAEAGIPFERIEGEWLEGLMEDRSFLIAFISEQSPIAIIFILLPFAVIIGFLVVFIRRRRQIRRME